MKFHVSELILLKIKVRWLKEDKTLKVINIDPHSGLCTLLLNYLRLLRFIYLLRLNYKRKFELITECDRNIMRTKDFKLTISPIQHTVLLNMT